MVEPPASWQALQEVVTPVWFMAAVGTGVAKRWAGAAATAGSKVDGVLPKWQVSQVVDVGKCWVDAAGPVVGGITTMESVPWKGPTPPT